MLDVVFERDGTGKHGFTEHAVAQRLLLSPYS